MSEILRELEKYGMKGTVLSDRVIASKKRPTFSVEMIVTKSEYEDELVIIGIDVEIKHLGTEFKYSMHNGYERVYLHYQKGEITGNAKGIIHEMYLPKMEIKEVLTSSRVLYNFVRHWSSFEYLLPEDYLR